jgi:hypothetical protein
MALNANTWTPAVFEAGPDQGEWTEGLGTVSVYTGYYRNPARVDEEIRITRLKVITNQQDQVIREEDERWQYQVPGSPPLRYDRTIRARVYLPGLGRALHTVEDETHYFWAFSPLDPGANLGRTRVVNAYVVYDIPQDPTKAATEDGKKKAEEAGMKPGTLQDRIVASGKLWSEANLTNAIVTETGHAQATKWIEGVVVEQDEVEEEFDKWTIWKTEKQALRAGGIKVTGPEYIKKESYEYKLPVPLEPPKISASAATTGVTVEIEGGGANINNSYFGNAGRYHVPPKKYHVYRRVEAEPTRDADANLYGWWDTPPSAPSSRLYLEDTAVTELDGSPTTPPNSALPVASSYTEPHDPSPEDQPPDASFRRVATVDNRNGRQDAGAATWQDRDCEDTAEYEYYATAVYASQESTHSNHDTVTFAGSGGTRSYRMTNNEDTIDAIAADDAAYPDEEFGEVLQFDLPVAGEESYREEVAREVADRQFAANRPPDMKIQATVLEPLLGLEWGQKIGLPNVSWETVGNGIMMSTRTEADSWMLVGFSRTLVRKPDGMWGTKPETILTLQERPKPT